MIRVFIGYDSKEPVAYSVFAHSILRRASEPVSITPVALKHLPMTRERVATQSTEFSFSRFLVPWLCDFDGWAIFADCDQLCLGDIARLWAKRDERFAVQVVKHDHKPTTTTKFLGQAQTTYPKKNWSSVMLMNCRRCRRLTPHYVNTASGLDLHRFEWLKGAVNDKYIPQGDELIGEIPREWNHLVGYDVPTGGELNLHFTEGGPWFPAYANGPFADLWRRERAAAFEAAR
jgi:lipopolysaccharide biosynthesis glycosyltransferase